MKNLLTCGEATERLVECSRERVRPDELLRCHLEICASCQARWEAEQSLSAGLRVLRMQASAARPAAGSRAGLLREFEGRRRKNSERRWAWGLAAAAVLVLCAGLVRDLTKEPETAVRTAMVAEEPSDPQQEGFIEVPYAPPLAQGELVRVVHTELQPAALASMGLNVDPAWTAELPADLLLGQDGFPRAVRISDDASGESGF